MVDPLSLAGFRNNGFLFEGCVVVGFGVVLVVCGARKVGGRRNRNRGLLFRREDSVVVDTGCVGEFCSSSVYCGVSSVMVVVRLSSGSNVSSVGGVVKVVLPTLPRNDD